MPTPKGIHRGLGIQMQLTIAARVTNARDPHKKNAMFRRPL